MVGRTIWGYYNRNAKILFEKYQSLSSDKVHASWLGYLPSKPSLALDVGGGAGRDAAWLAQKGWEVIAVEPAKAMFDLGQKATIGYSVTWINDCLPVLAKLNGYQKKFSLILVSGVLMHLPYQQRIDSMKMLTGLMAANAVLVITLRQGPDAEGRKFYNVPTNEIVQFALEKSLQVEVSDTLPDELNREGVTWQSIIVGNRVSR